MLALSLLQPLANTYPTRPWDAFKNLIHEKAPELLKNKHTEGMKHARELSDHRRLSKIDDLNTMFGSLTDRDWPGGMPVNKTIKDFETGAFSGVVTGRVFSDGIERYVGIPVAQSTAYSNRFMYPKSGRMYTGEVIKERFCFFADILGYEDCVSVDIVTMTKFSEEPAAVLCWIHGGGFTAIDNASPKMRMNAYYADAGVVRINMHYRLGCLGWCSFNVEGSNGNFGMSDIVAELQWIQMNIRTFGGDMGRVTIMGESAGAAHVTALMASPMMEGLFHHAIAESPFIALGDAAFSPISRMETTRLAIMGMGLPNASWGVPSGLLAEEELYVLQTVPPGYVDYAYGATARSGFENVTFDEYYGMPGLNGLAAYTGIQSWPVVDGKYMTLPPLQAFEAGINGNVDFITGMNHDELITFYNSGGFPAILQDIFVAEGTPAPFPEQTFAGTFDYGPYLVGDRCSITASHTLPYPSNVATFFAKAFEYASDATYIGTMNHLYNYTEPIINSIQASTDSWLGNSVGTTIDARMKGKMTGMVSAETYQFFFGQGQAEVFSKKAPGWGACHGCDLTYTLGLYVYDYSYPMLGVQGYASILMQVFTAYGYPFNLMTSAPVVWPIKYSDAEKAVGTAMLRHWTGLMKYSQPGSDWPAAAPGKKHVMVYNDGLVGGSQADVCVKMSPYGCFAEPTYNLRSEKWAFWQTGVHVDGPHPTCEAPLGSLSIVAQGTCPEENCAGWCNAYTCGTGSCSGCSVCHYVETDSYCAGWCNPYTCSMSSYCGGCSVCPVVENGEYCASWCNSYTMSMNMCKGC